MKQFKYVYDEKRKVGYLCDYILHGLVKDGYLSDFDWRSNSYSPEILDYKLGNDSDIKKFLLPFSELLEKILNSIEINKRRILLVPVPPSRSEDDQEYTTTPGKRGGKNRDDRNIIFCGFLERFLKDKYPSIHAFNSLKRIKSIKKKDKKMSPAMHKKTMGIIMPNSEKIHNDDIIILVDDVFTYGNTFSGARLVMKEKFPNAEFICAAIGRTHIRD